MSDEINRLAEDVLFLLLTKADRTEDLTEEEVSTFISAALEACGLEVVERGTANTLEEMTGIMAQTHQKW